MSSVCMRGRNKRRSLRGRLACLLIPYAACLYPGAHHAAAAHFQLPALIAE